ncbi:MAG: dihydroorotase [Candidatus Thermoplasmatota archaeon]|nr:dihydroorotase [Candidatus Thermoplasmatota archaeon]
MEKADLAIDGTFYIDGLLVKTSVGIRNGRISSIRRGVEADERVAFENSIILPGAVDLHVHFREPGLTQKEDIESGSLSAAFGGVTCVGEMPNTVPPAITPERVEKKIDLFKKKSYVDFVVYGGLMKGVRVAPLSKKAAAFKLFMGSSTGDLVCDDPELQMELIRSAAESGKLVIVHAEDESRRNRISESNLRDHYRSRPPECETEAVKRLIGFSNTDYHPRIHVAHATLRESVEMAHPDNLTFEVTPHHLLLDYDMHLGTFGKVNPPLRRRDDRIALIRLLNSGLVDTIGSDHSPHTPEEKADDFDYAPSGIPGVETMLPLMLNLVVNEEMKLETLVRAISENPSKLLHLKKGKIAVGYDADLVVVNLRRTSVIKGDNLHSRCGWTPFEGFSAIFPERVYLRGKELISGSAIAGRPKARNAAE